MSCGSPPKFNHADVELLNKSIVWRSIARYTCEVGYSLSPGVLHWTIECRETGLWEESSNSCSLDDDRNLPVKVRDENWKNPDYSSESGFEADEISMGVVSSIALLLVAIGGAIFFTRYGQKSV